MSSIERRAPRRGQPEIQTRTKRRRVSKGIAIAALVPTVAAVAYYADLIYAGTQSGHITRYEAQGKPGALGGKGMSVAGGGDHEASDSDTETSTKPLNQYLARQTQEDGVLRVAEWNMHNQLYKRAEDVVNLISTKRLDVLVGEEANSKGVQRLTDMLPPGYHVVSVNTGAAWAPNHKDVVNFAVTNQWPREIDSASLGGSPHTAGLKRMVGDLASDAWNDFTQPGHEPSYGFDIRKNIQSDRAILGLKINEKIGKKDTNVYLGVTHLSYITESPEHARQISGVNTFMDQHMGETALTLLCGDFNYPDPSGMRRAFAKYSFDETGPTLVGGTEPIDYCLRRSSPDIGVKYTSRTEVLPEMTDHHAIMMEVRAATE